MSSLPRLNLPADLPTPRSPMIGREREVTAACALLVDDAVPLLTLTGPGGVGKTRLALAVAAAVAGAFADGLAFVDIGPIRDRPERAPALLLPAIAHAVGVREGGTRLLHDDLVAFLRPRQLLLILDNCEHLLDAAPQVGELLQACPALQVLATSRAPLRLRGEHDFPVPLLAVADPTHVPPLAELARTEAVALLVARARAVRPDFALTEANAAAVAEVCARLDGLPLALELAAVRLKLLSPHALLALLADRLTLLTGGTRDAPARHRTLRDTIAWSYDLLTPEEQTLFRRVAVFVGGFELDSVAPVIGDGSWVIGESTPSSPSPTVVFDGLAALIDQSLLRRSEADEGRPDASAPRFAMLETIREFGLERLTDHGEEVGLRSRHAAYFLAMAEQAESHAIGPEQAPWLERLEREHANLRAALTWLADRGPAEQALRLAAALAHFWEVHGHWDEGRRWLDRLLTVTGDSTADAAIRARAAGGAGKLALLHGELERAAAYQAESLALSRTTCDQQGIATALTNAAYLAHEQGDTDRAESLFQEAVGIYRALGDHRGLAFALDSLGVITMKQDDPARTTALLEESLAHSRATGDRWQHAVTLVNLGLAANHQADYGRARPYLDEGLELARAIGSNRLAAYALSCLGLIAQEAGEIRQAAALFADGLALCRELGGRLPTPRCLEGIATAAGSRGEVEHAARLLGAAAAMRAAFGTGRYPADRAIHDRTVATLHAAHGAAAFSAAWEAGRLLPPDRAIDEALDLAAALVGATPPPPVPTALASPLPPPSQVALSAREQEVLRLVAQRLTDKEIGDTLSISSRTAMTHVANILKKLGVASRREAAALAARDGLV